MNIRRNVHGHGIVLGLVLGISVIGAIATIPVDAAAGGVRAAPAFMPATGHAEVIAQSIVTFGDGAYHWAVVHEAMAVGADDVALSLIGPSFLVTAGGVIDLDGPIPARLASGEAAFLAAGSETVLNAVEGETSHYTIELSDSTTSDAASVFSPGAGRRDVNLLRDVISPGETLPITASASAPMLILVTAGAANVATEGSDDTAVGVGGTSLHDGAVAITPLGAEAVVVVIALVGDLVDDVTPTTTGPSTSVTESGPGDAGSATSDVATSTTTSATSTSTTSPSGPTTPSAPVDTGTVQAQLPTIPPDTGTVQAELPTLQLDDDGDGLSNSAEARAGTDPNDRDTDGDEVSDGGEVNYLHTNPLSADTDGDGYADGDEIYYNHTDPLIPDP